MSHKDKKTKYRNSVWLIAAILLILLIITFILLGLFLQQRAARDINVISLTGENTNEDFESDESGENGNKSDGQSPNGSSQKDTQDTSKDTVSDTEKITDTVSKTETITDTVTTQKKVTEQVEKKEPADEEPGLITEDRVAQWETSTSVDLFKTAYTNENGEITVQSSNGDKLIAPGTSNDYTFTLKNTGNISLDYTLNMSCVFQMEHTDIPIQIRFRKGNTWLVGDEDTWKDTSALDNLSEKDTLGVNRYVSYTLEWQWTFENDEIDMMIATDVFDTTLGNAAVTQNMDFHLNIETQSEVTPGAVPTDANGDPIYKTIVETIEKLIPVEREVSTDGQKVDDSENTENNNGDSETDNQNSGEHTGDQKTEPNIPKMDRWGLVGLLLGILWGIFFLLIFWRRRIYITGFVTTGTSMKFGRAESEIEEGRFIFTRARFGKSTLCALDENGNEISGLEVQIKRDRDVQGMKYEDGKLLIGKKVIAVEIYVDSSAGDLEIDPKRWAAIDKDHNVITPDGIKEPEDECNVTPGGLKIDENDNLIVE